MSWTFESATAQQNDLQYLSIDILGLLHLSLLTTYPNDCSFEVDAACEECTSLCTKSKPCGHSCIMPCHAGLCPPCPETVRQKCHCQSMILKFSCGKLASVTEKEKLELFSCKIQCPVLMPCGHPCVKLCHVASEPHSQPAECKRKVPVKCSCGRLKEQQQCFKVTTGYKLVCDAECRALNHARLKVTPVSIP